MAKFIKRRGQYENSTGSFTFNPETHEARSYGHWQFMKEYKGVILFNAYSYSNSTSKHQSEARRLAGYPEMVQVNTRESLDYTETAIKTAIRSLHSDNDQLARDIAKPRTRKATNERRASEINHNKMHILKLESLL